jgi:hypothetical protein
MTYQLFIGLAISIVWVAFSMFYSFLLYSIHRKLTLNNIAIQMAFIMFMPFWTLYEYHSPLSLPLFLLGLSAKVAAIYYFSKKLVRCFETYTDIKSMGQTQRSFK